MNWDRYVTTMEKHVIKTDVIASEDDYFLATHMPFSNLEVTIGGKESGSKRLLSEEEIYQTLIYNPDDIHRLIIVRGNNGTGKSHLIRWLKARFENDAERYDPEREKIVFLRRLNNTIRGAIGQMLEERLISDPEMITKLQRFVHSASSQDPDELKTTILHAYITLIANDKSERFYKSFICQGIQQFLYDPRIQAHLKRPGGAIDRCYQAITAPGDSVFGGEPIFDADDFTIPSAQMRELCKKGSDEAKDFAEQIYDNREEINKLVKYLNQFTPKVIQSCAEISSESTKEVFKQLRQTLKQQGKGLTIFIEDLTAFTGIDAELITVLAAEHGGENSDLCRVTAVIGITDAYYSQFKDNFTDRVQYQITITENAYNDQEFLQQLTARYLNAIYCKPEDIRNWFANGADLSKLPVATFKPDYPWDSVTINNHSFTLYPFTKNSLAILYNSLRSRTPRKFLTEVLRSQLKEFFDGKQSDQWRFPTPDFIADVADPAVQMDPIHVSAVDKQQNLSEKDKTRLKLLLAVWGDKTGNITKRDGETYIGALPQKFLAEIGFGHFEGSGQGKSGLAKTKGESKTNDAPVPPPKPQVTQRDRQYHARRRDINAWYGGKSELAYSADYRRWILEFLREAINWQAEGVPAHLAGLKLKEQDSVYIHGQSQAGHVDKAIVALEKSVETYELLHALNDYNYHGGWNFPEAAYYQLRLVHWLERNKKVIVAKVCGSENVKGQWPVLEWALAVQYLIHNILGTPLDKSSTMALAKSLFQANELTANTNHRSSKWKDVLQYIQNNAADFDLNKELMTEIPKTYMGTISRYQKTSVPFYRSEEIINAIERLQAIQWDLRPLLPQHINEALALKPAVFLKNLYSRIEVIVADEMEQAKTTIEHLRKILGGTIDRDSIINVLNAVLKLFETFNSNRIHYNSALKSKFDIKPIERAELILADHARIQELLSTESLTQRLELLSSNPLESLASLADDLKEIEGIALKEKQTAENELKMMTGGVDIDKIINDGIDYLSNLAEKISSLEVNSDANRYD